MGEVAHRIAAFVEVVRKIQCGASHRHATGPGSGPVEGIAVTMLHTRPPAHYFDLQLRRPMVAAAPSKNTLP